MVEQNTISFANKIVNNYKAYNLNNCTVKSSKSFTTKNSLFGAVILPRNKVKKIYLQFS